MSNLTYPSLKLANMQNLKFEKNARYGKNSTFWSTTFKYTMRDHLFLSSFQMVKSGKMLNQKSSKNQENVQYKKLNLYLL